MIDTHNHLYFDKFDADREEVIARMAEAGVVGGIVIGIDPPTWEQAQALARQYPQLHYSAGLHPTSDFAALTGGALTRFVMEELSILCESDTPPVAIGECGIDLHWDVNPLEHQQTAFTAQLNLCKQRDLPVIIHTRDANGETLEVLESVAGVRGVLHCFNGSPELLEFALSREGWYVSFAGNLTYPKATELHEAARQVPLDRLLVETDAPFLAPQPVRGKRCEPAHVVHTARYLADLRGVPEDELFQNLLANSRRCFNLSF
jgi:TatD DNase family protein